MLLGQLLVAFTIDFSDTKSMLTQDRNNASGASYTLSYHITLLHME
jgi:hypothetical protein